MTTDETLRGNYERIRTEIADAAVRGGRPAEAVRLVAVTKAVSTDAIAALVELGQTDLGENRVGQLLERAEWARGAGLEVRWHMIGHLQRRKVRDLLPAVAAIHSVDSLRLAEEIQSRAAAGGGEAVPMFLEVNVSGEEQKYGLRPDEVEAVVRSVAGLDRVDLRGLMTMAPFTDDEDVVRGVFRGLRELRDRLNDAGAYGGRGIAELSMGMSQDYRVAVEEGATVVRVGTALFS